MVVCQALAKVLVYVLFLCLYYAIFNAHSFLRQFARCLLPRVRCHNKIKRKIMVNSDYPALILTQHDIILRARVHVTDAKTGGTSQNAFLSANRSETCRRLLLLQSEPDGRGRLFIICGVVQLFRLQRLASC